MGSDGPRPNLARLRPGRGGEVRQEGILEEEERERERQEACERKKGRKWEKGRT